MANGNRGKRRSVRFGICILGGSSNRFRHARCHVRRKSLCKVKSILAHTGPMQAAIEISFDDQLVRSDENGMDFPEGPSEIMSTGRAKLNCRLIDQKRSMIAWYQVGAMHSRGAFPLERKRCWVILPSYGCCGACGDIGIALRATAIVGRRKVLVFRARIQ